MRYDHYTQIDMNMNKTMQERINTKIQIIVDIKSRLIDRLI